VRLSRRSSRFQAAPLNPQLTTQGFDFGSNESPTCSYSLPCIARSSLSPLCFAALRGFGVVIEPIEDEIRELCARVAAADRSELPEVVADLRTALKRHADQLKLITLRTINAFPPSKSKAAD
jgi:hypothetical protein